MDYTEFIENKRRTVAHVGFETDHVHSALYPFQREVVRWSLRMGRAALFEDCGFWARPFSNWNGRGMSRITREVGC